MKVIPTLVNMEIAGYKLSTLNISIKMKKKILKKLQKKKLLKQRLDL